MSTTKITSEILKIESPIRDYQIAKQNVESFYAAQQSWDIEEDKL